MWHLNDVFQQRQEIDFMLGELIPVGGGDPIPLLKKKLLVGRRESCDIVLRFPNVSAHHCQLHIDSGYWYVKDMNSRNGCKVNNERVQEKRLDPGDTVSVAKHTYEVRYSPTELGAVGPPPTEDNVEDIFGQSLLEKAGLASPQDVPTSSEDVPVGRYDVHNDDEGQIKDPNRPV